MGRGACMTLVLFALFATFSISISALKFSSTGVFFLATCAGLPSTLAMLILLRVTLLFRESFLGGETGSKRRVSGKSSSRLTISTSSSSESSEKLFLDPDFADRPLLVGGLELVILGSINSSSIKLELMLLRALAAAVLEEGIFPAWLWLKWRGSGLEEVEELAREQFEWEAP